MGKVLWVIKEMPRHLFEMVFSQGRRAGVCMRSFWSFAYFFCHLKLSFSKEGQDFWVLPFFSPVGSDMIGMFNFRYHQAPRLVVAAGEKEVVHKI